MQTNYIFKENLNSQKIIKELQLGNSLILIEEFPLSDYAFQKFIDRIGKPIKENRNNNELDVFDVKISKQNNLFRSIANSNLSFPLHTDCADFNSIPNCIGLLCVEPAILEQGTNTFVMLEKVLKNLSKIEIEELTKKEWNFRNQYRNILSYNSNKYKICYDRITIESFSKITNSEINLLNKLDKVFKENSFKLKLKKGNLILFRNDLMLHGRTAIDLESNRLIKRIRFNIE